MSVWEAFRAVKVPPSPVKRARPRFSLTSDIISYRRCARQYGHFGNDGFVPAQATQIFYGTVIHQVLDMCHRHWRGLMGAPARTLPTDDDVKRYFDEVQNALRFHGVRAVSPKVGEQALHVIKVFNKLEGPSLYDRVHESEYRLESDRTDYILRGVVDVLARSPAEPEDWSQMEIWDYKGINAPSATGAEMRLYRWQMLVYAELYRQRSGVYPAKAVLYFLGEIKDIDPTKDKRPKRALVEISITPDDVQQALAEFDKSAREIMAARTAGMWPAPPQGAGPPTGTCEICDIRWSCSTPTPPFTVRLPFA